MYQKIRPLFLICETPLHAGSGNDLGYVDMPIQRERHTSFPKIEASSLKGALRQSFEENTTSFRFQDSDTEGVLVNYEDNSKKIYVEKAFGPDKPDGDNGFAAALGFTDARLLLFPIKSLKGVFAWITCPKVLEQFQRDVNSLDTPVVVTDIPPSLSEGEFIALEGSNVVIDSENIILEEYTFKKSDNTFDVKADNKALNTWLSEKLFPQPKQGEKDIYNFWRNKIQKDIIILSDTDFADFVNLATEVITRTAINNETGTVKGTALFTEEYLPSESIMYSLVLSSPEFSNKPNKWDAEKVMTFFEKGLKPVIQLGGNATLGKGLLRTKLI